MVQFYSRLLLLLFVICFSPSISRSQVSVAATAGNQGPVAYATLKAAFDAVNAGSHQGAITVTVSANTTETASAELKGSGSGASSYTSILIKPAPGVVAVIAAALSNALMILDGARNVTIDGSNTAGGTTKNLTISSNALAGSAIIFRNGASSNTVKNAVVRASTRTTGVIVMSTSTAPEGNNNNTIENNDITRGEGGAALIGIHNTGTNGKPNTGNVYRNNRIFNFLYFGFSDGDDFGTVGFSNNTLFEGNELFGTEAQSSNIIAIFISHPTGISNMTISKNKIHSLTATGPYEGITAIMLLDAVSVTVVNNMISLADGGFELRGISQETAAGATIKIYNNTILISGTTSGDKRSFVLFKNWFSTGDDIRNNMFVNTRVSSGTGRQYAFIKIQPGTFTSNYNNLVSTGNALNLIGGVGNTNEPTLYQTFDQWKTGTGQDANSISVQPAFVATTDLHLVPANNAALDNKGTPIAGVTTDIDGETRSTTTPDMGVDEFSSTTTAVARIDASVTGAVLMPNVVDKTAVLRVRTARAMKINWTIVNMHGQQVKVFSSAVSAGVNDIELELSGLSTGIYQIVGHTSKGRTELIRLIKR
jgi:hypothetical protein